MLAVVVVVFPQFSLSTFVQYCTANALLGDFLFSVDRRQVCQSCQISRRGCGRFFLLDEFLDGFTFFFPFPNQSIIPLLVWQSLIKLVLASAIWAAAFCSCLLRLSVHTHTSPCSLLSFYCPARNHRPNTASIQFRWDIREKRVKEAQCR